MSAREGCSQVLGPTLKCLGHSTGEISRGIVSFWFLRHMEGMWSSRRLVGDRWGSGEQGQGGTRRHSVALRRWPAVLTTRFINSKGRHPVIHRQSSRVTLRLRLKTWCLAPSGWST